MLFSHTARIRITIEAASTQQARGSVNDTKLVVISMARRPAYSARRCIRGTIINNANSFLLLSNLTVPLSDVNLLTVP